MERVLRELRAASRMEPLDRTIFIADGDFDDNPQCSQERLALTGVVLPTQTMLRRQCLRLKAKHGEEAGVTKFNLHLQQPPKSDPEDSIDKEMERQKSEYYEVLFKQDRAHKGKTAVPPPPLMQPIGWTPPAGHRLVEDPTLGSGYSGLNPLAEAARLAGVGITKFDAESHPRIRRHLMQLNPEAEHFADVVQLMEESTMGTVQLLQLSPTCIAFADPNRYGKGRADSEFGSAYEQCGHIVEHVKPLRALIECTRGVLRRPGGEPSTVDLLKRNAPSYFIQVLADVDAGRVRSSLSNEKSKLKHHRCWVVLDRKDCFEKVSSVEVHNEDPDKEFDSILHKSGQAPGYLCMPDTDQRHLDFSTAHQAKEGASYVAKIFQPSEAGRGHHNFVTEVVAPRLGRCPPWTATGASVWILRQMNKRATITRMTNAEGAKAYCAGTHRNFPAEWLEDRSYLGQSCIGNAIPNNVMDEFYVQSLKDISKIQRDGKTPQENWLRLHSMLPEGYQAPASGGRGKRKERTIDVSLDEAIHHIISKVQDNAKAPKTVTAYATHVEQWIHVAHQKGWSPFLDELEKPEAQRRVLYWMGYELAVHQLSARSMRGKLSALRWHHVRNMRCNPLEEMVTVKDWIGSLEKINGPAQQKLPVPTPLLEALLTAMSTSHNHLALGAAICTGFWWCLRASECLADDGAAFDPDRAITWSDVFCRVVKNKTRKTITTEELPVAILRGQVCEITLRLFSNKNNLNTCTRTVRMVKGSATCPVQAIAKLVSSTLSSHGVLSPREAVFRKITGEAISRDMVSQALKLAAAAAGVPAVKIASHSLRRGGASAYVAAGASEEAIIRFGRWTSEAYQAYVYPHAEMLYKALRKACKEVPRFELR